MEHNLGELKKWADEISGQWDGETTKGEERATCAREIVDKITELETLLEELEQY